MVREFAKLARTHYSTKSKFQSPQDFRKALKNIASYLCDGDQHDSHELMVMIRIVFLSRTLFYKDLKKS